MTETSPPAPSDATPAKGQSLRDRVGAWLRTEKVVRYGPGWLGVVAAIVLGLLDGLVWDRSPIPFKESDPSIWQIVFASPVTLGFVRILIIGVTVYAVASAVALAARGRWIVKFGSGGFEAEAAEKLRDADRDLEASEARERELLDEIAEARRIIESQSVVISRLAGLLGLRRVPA